MASILKYKVGDRVIIVKAEGTTIGKMKIPLRDPHPEHIGKSGTIVAIDEEDGMPHIKLDDGTELEGGDCWWQPKGVKMGFEEIKKKILESGISHPSHVTLFKKDLENRSLSEMSPKVEAGIKAYRTKPDKDKKIKELEDEVKTLKQGCREAGYFQEEAEWIGKLVEEGWIPPEEAKRYVRLDNLTKEQRYTIWKSVEAGGK